MGLISNGSTVFDNGSMSSGFGSSLRFISKQTASASANISFTSGIDSSYKEYLFTFNNIHPQTDGAIFQFNLSTDGGSNYNVTKTSTMFSAYHNESGDQTDLSYRTPGDLAQSTAFQNIASPDSISSDNDHSLSGTFTIFNPSSTTFVKHFMSNCSHNNVSDFEINVFLAGYGNTTSAVDGIRFQMNSGNIDAGDICLYGIA